VEHGGARAVYLRHEDPLGVNGWSFPHFVDEVLPGLSIELPEEDAEVLFDILDMSSSGLITINDLYRAVFVHQATGGRRMSSAQAQAEGVALLSSRSDIAKIRRMSVVSAASTIPTPGMPVSAISTPATYASGSDASRARRASAFSIGTGFGHLLEQQRTRLASFVETHWSNPTAAFNAMHDRVGSHGLPLITPMDVVNATIGRRGSTAGQAAMAAAAAPVPRSLPSPFDITLLTALFREYHDELAFHPVIAGLEGAAINLDASAALTMSEFERLLMGRRPASLRPAPAVPAWRGPESVPTAAGLTPRPMTPVVPSPAMPVSMQPSAPGRFVLDEAVQVTPVDLWRAERDEESEEERARSRRKAVRQPVPINQRPPWKPSFR
jgi:hypothetical protein